MKAVSLLKTNLKALVLSFCAATMLICVSAQYFPFEFEDTADVFSNTVRLRVVANSDSAEDQELKLCVRNDIIDTATALFENCKSIDAAKEKIEKNGYILEAAAKESVINHGYSYPVSVYFGTEHCPVRRYRDFVFPAGEYMTLRIDIGNAKGKNWWCVMYPPLCVSAATNDVYADRKIFFDRGFTQSELDKLSYENQTPTVKLAVSDFFKSLF